jgi:hypothetical protein
VPPDEVPIAPPPEPATDPEAEQTQPSPAAEGEAGEA